MVYPTFKLGPYPWARLSIDLIYTLERLVHCTHTTEPMASRAHSGGPTAFRKTRPTAMTLSRPPRPTPPWSSVLGGPVPTKGITATIMVKTSTVVAKQKRSQTGTKACKIQLRAHKAYVRLPDQGSAPHNLPSLEAPLRGTAIASH